MYSALISLTISILSILMSTFAAPAPQYPPFAPAAPVAKLQYPAEYLIAPAVPAADQRYPSEHLAAQAAPVTSKYTEIAKQYAPGYPTAPAAASQGYFCYKGRDFPNKEHWHSFNALRILNLPKIIIENKPETVTTIFQAIQTISARAEIDPRIVFMMIMQESSGQTFKSGDFDQSSGLMQVQPANGEQGIRCSPDYCTSDEITGMIEQGVLGTTTGDTPVAPGIAYWLKIQGYDLPRALRAYNSGHVPDPDDLSIATPISTASYVSDIGNRLIGLAPEKFLLSRSATCGFAPTPSWA